MESITAQNCKPTATVKTAKATVSYPQAEVSTEEMQTCENLQKTYKNLIDL